MADYTEEVVRVLSCALYRDDTKDMAAAERDLAWALRWEALICLDGDEDLPPLKFKRPTGVIHG